MIRHVRSPWMLVTATILFVTLRWAWIGGTGDFALHYDWARRILDGDVAGRDYVTTLVPGSAYLLAGLLSLFGTHLIWHQVFLHLCWGAGLAVGLACALRIAGSDQSARRFAMAGLLVAVPLSFPISTLTIPHNDLATTLIGGALLVLLSRPTDRSWWAPIVSGLLLGASVWAKQNIGIACCVGLVGFMLIGHLVRGGDLFSVRRVLGLGIGCIVSIFGIALLFASSVDLREQADLYLSSAATGKGGLERVLARPLPRIILEEVPAGTHRLVMEIGLSAAIVLLLAWWLWHAWGRLRADGRAARELRFMWLWGLLCALVMLWLVALLPWPAARAVGAALAALVEQTSLQAFSLNLAYIVLVCAAGTLLLRGGLPYVSRRRFTWQPLSDAELLGLATVLVVVMGHATSSIYYTHSSILLAGPIVTMLAHRYWQLGRRGVALLVMIPALAGALSPQSQPSFEPLVKLPDNSPFAGLYAPLEMGATLTRDWKLLSPLLAGREVLWLAPLIPSAAFGGHQVPGVAGLYQSTHGRQHEIRFLAEWQQRPPEIVVQKPFGPIANSYWAEDGRLQTWLETHYRRVVDLPDLIVWQLTGTP